MTYVPSQTDTYFFEEDEMTKLVKRMMVRNGNRRQIAAFVDEEFYNKLRRLSRDSGHSMAAIMKIALRIYMATVEVVEEDA